MALIKKPRPQADYDALKRDTRHAEFVRERRIREAEA